MQQNATLRAFGGSGLHTAGGYEARGMVTKLGSGTVQMAYDAEGNMKNTSDSGTGQSITWIYDAEGKRAQKLVSGGSWTLYVHDAFGKLAASYNNNGVTPDCNGTCYLTYDMLGSIRLVTDTNQNVVARHDFIPFGEEIPNGTAGRNGNFAGSSNVTQGFTGQEADGGTASLDFYDARHFAAALGSFVQPDPMNAGADILRPQSWNAYAYVLGNPLGGTDPSGMALGCDKVCGVGRSDGGVIGYSGGGDLGGDDGYSGVTDGNCFSAAASAPCGSPTFGTTVYSTGAGGGTHSGPVTVITAPPAPDPSPAPPASAPLGQSPATPTSSFFAGRSDQNNQNNSDMVYLVCASISTGVGWQDALASVLGLKHCWLRTSSKTAGLGPAKPGPLPNNPFGVPVAITDQSDRKGGTATLVPHVNAACVNAELQIGASCGTWGITNNCNTFANKVLAKCRVGQWEPSWGPYQIPVH